MKKSKFKTLLGLAFAIFGMTAVTATSVHSRSNVKSVKASIASVDDVLWAEDFSGFSSGDVPSESNANSIVYGDASLTYSSVKGGSDTKIYNEKLAGGTAPELLVSKSGGSFTALEVPTGGAKVMSLTFNSNNSNLSVSVSDSNYTVSALSSNNSVYTATISLKSGETASSTFNVMFSNSKSGNSRLDSISLIVTEAGEGGTTTTKTITSVVISGSPTKKDYFEGDTFNTSGLVVTAHYDDKSSEDVTSDAKFTCDPETLVKGNTSVSVVATYKNVNSDPYTVSGLVVTKSTEKTVTFDFGSEGKSAADIVDGYTVGAFELTLVDNNTSSNPTTNLNPARFYTNFILTFTGDSTVQRIKSISVGASSGGSAAYSNAFVNGSLTSGTNSLEKDIDYTVKASSTSSPFGASVTFLGDYTEVSVNLAAQSRLGFIDLVYVEIPTAELTSISIETQPSNKNYSVGDTFDTTGMVVKANYDDNSSKTITDYTVIYQGGDTATSFGASDTKVTISYEGKTVDVTGIVVSSLDNISITTAAKTDYRNGELFDVSSLVVKKQYALSSGSYSNPEQIISGLTYKIGDKTLTPGTTVITDEDDGATVTVSYTENNVTKTVTYTLSVGSSYVTGVTIDNTEIELGRKNSITLSSTVSPETADQSVTYSASSETLVEGIDYTLVGNVLTIGDNANAGSLTIKATTEDTNSSGSKVYDEITLSILDHVICVLSDIQVSGSLTNEQIQNKDFDPTGLTFTPVYSPLDPEEPDVITGDSFIWSTLDEAGTQDVIGTYKENSAIKVTIENVSVTQDKITKLIVGGDLTKKSYYENETGFNFEGLTVAGKYLSGKDATDQDLASLTITYVTETPFADMSVGDNQTIRVKAVATAIECEWFSVSGIEIKANNFVGIEIDDDLADVKTSYTLGEEIDLTNLVVEKVFANSKEPLSIDVCTTNIDEIDMCEEGTKTVTITYTVESTPYTDSYDITVTKATSKKVWELVTSSTTLTAGDQLLIVGKEGDNYYALAPYDSGNNCKRNEVSAPVNDCIDTEVACLTLGGSAADGWTLFDGAKYLYAAGGTKNNYLKGASSADNDNAKWSINVDDSGNATIVTIDTDVTKNTIRHNTTNDLFSCYESGQADISLYRAKAQVGKLIKVNAALSEAGALKDWKDGDTVTKSDLTVIAHYNTGESKTITDYTLSNATISAASPTVTISYNENDVTKTCTLTINDIRAAIKIATLDFTDTSDTMIYDKNDNTKNGDTATNQSATLKVAINRGGDTPDDQAVIWDYDEELLSLTPGTTAVDDGVLYATATVSAIKTIEADTTSVIKVTANDSKDGATPVSAEYSLNVKHDVITGISVVSAPTKTIYDHGDNFVADGLVITTTYSSGKTFDVSYSDTNASDFSFAPTSMSSSENNGVIVTYAGKTATINDLTVNKVVDHIGASYTQGDKVYFVGDATFDKTGLEVTVYYTDGTTADVTESALVTPNTSSAGTNAFTISYASKETTINVVVTGIELSSISVDTEPTNKPPYTGHDLVLDGLVVTAHYNNGSSADVSNAVTVTGYNKNVSGEQTVTVSYTEGGITKTDTFSVNPASPKHNGIEFVSAKELYYVGDQFDPSGLTIKFTYDDISKEGETVAYSDSNKTQFSFTGFDSSAEATNQVVTVNYTEGSGASAVTFTTTFEVDITEATIDSSELIKNDFTIYIGETFSETVQIKHTLSSGHTVIENCTIVGTIDNATEQDLTVYVKAPSTGDTQYAITIHVLTKHVESVTLDKDSVDLVIGKTNSDNVTLVATLNPTDPTDKTLIWTSSDTSVATVNSSGKVTAVGNGTCTITVKSKDGNYTDTCTINVTTAVSGVTISQGDSYTVHPGDIDSLTAVINPTTATNQNVTWTTTDATVCAVDNQGNLTPIKNGTVTITVTTEDGSFSDSITVHVTTLVNQMDVGADKTVYLGDSSFGLTATVNDDATDKSVTWISSDTSVATVDSNGNVTIVGKGTAIITATANDGSNVSDSMTVTVKVHVSTVTVTGYTSTDIYVGNEMDLTAVINPTDADNQEVTWTTSDSTVGTIDEFGHFEAVGFGTVTITATSVEGNKQDSVTFTVTIQATSITVNKTEVLLTEGGNNYPIIVTVGAEDATDKTFYAVSDNPNVATYEDGEIVPHAVGTTTITLIASSNSDVKVVISVEVAERPVPVENIIISKTSIEIAIDEDYYLTAKVTPNNATNKEVTWSVRDSSIASVDQNGHVIGLKEGTTVISVISSNGLVAQCSVTVYRPIIMITSIEVTCPTSLNVGDEAKINVTCDPVNAEIQVYDFISSDKSVLTVDENGNAKAVGNGVAYITVKTTDGSNISEKIMIIVSRAIVPVESVTLIEHNVNMFVGDETNLLFKVSGANSALVITYSSNNESVAIVDNNGHVTALANGQAIITVDVNGVTDTCVIVVKTKVSGVSISGNATITDANPFDTFSLTATVYPTDATNKDVTWSSDNTFVALINSEGKVTIVNEGVVTFTVRTNDGLFSDSLTVTISLKKEEIPVVDEEDVKEEEIPQGLLAGCEGSLIATSLGLTLLTTSASFLLISKKRKEDK